MVKPVKDWGSPGHKPGRLGGFLPKAGVGCLIFSILIIISAPMSKNTQAGSPPPQVGLVKITRAVEGSPSISLSGWPSLSADGSSVAFSSQAGNLVPNDGNPASDVFLYNTGSRATQVVSLTSDGAPANGGSFRPSVSANGRYIAFTSLASNLDAADTNGLRDIYLHDRQSGTTQWISRPPDGSPSNGWSDQVSLSADGEAVLFTSTATNLLSGVSKSVRRVYLYNTRNKHLRAISDSSEDATLSSISADGRYIALVVSRGSNSGLFIYDLTQDSMMPLELNITTPNWQQNTRQLEISADGSRIALLVSDRNSAAIYLYHRQHDQLINIASLGSLPSPSSNLEALAMPADGRTLVYATGKGIFLYHLESTKTRELVNFSGITPGQTVSEQVAISADGQVIAFQAKTDGNSELYYLEQGESRERRAFISGWIQNELGNPISGVEISDNAGHTVRSDAEGNFRFEEVLPGNYTISPIPENVSFSPTNYSVAVTQAGLSGLSFVANPGKIITEARKDIGMPYSLNRGCDSPLQQCGGPFHGFYRGDCTDLVIDAYAEGVGFDIQLALDHDFLANPRHYYRWRDARNAHDMWRYYSYTNQIIASSEVYLPGDIVFFDWELDGVVDHVALVSEVNNRGLPRSIIDATGVTTENPSGLAAEFRWKPFHADHTPGHTRWTGVRSGSNISSNNKIPILIISLDSPNVNLQLSDARGRRISRSSLEIPGGNYLYSGTSKIISVDQPLTTSEWFYIELSSPKEAAYQLGIQLVNSGIVIQHYPREGVIASGKSILIPIQLHLVDNQPKLTLPFSNSSR